MYVGDSTTECSGEASTEVETLVAHVYHTYHPGYDDHLSALVMPRREEEFDRTGVGDRVNRS